MRSSESVGLGVCFPADLSVTVGFYYEGLRSVNGKPVGKPVVFFKTSERQSTPNLTGFQEMEDHRSLQTCKCDGLSASNGGVAAGHAPPNWISFEPFSFPKVLTFSRLL